MYTWGNDKCGALGLKAVVEAFTPQKVELPEKIVSFSLYESHVGAISETGKLYTWGRGSEGTNFYYLKKLYLFIDEYECIGQIGWGKTDNTAIPVLPGIKIDEPFVHVSCAMFHTIAATQSHKLYAFGQGLSGQLGVSAQYVLSAYLIRIESYLVLWCRWKAELVPRLLEIKPKDIIFLRSGGRFNVLGTTGTALYYIKFNNKSINYWNRNRRRSRRREERSRF